MGNKKKKSTVSRNAANKTAAVREKNAGARSAATKKPINKKAVITVCSALLALVIIVGTVFTILHYIYNTPFDYMNGNISKYLKLSAEDYLGYEVNVTVPEPTDFDVDEKILQILCDNKSKTAENNGLWVVPLAAPIDNGWIVRIWYRGYTIDEDGNQVEFDGGCNFTSSEPEELEIGSGKFIPGFESGLIGKLITDYSTFTYNTSGFVESHDIVVVTMSAMYPDGKSESIKSGRIDLTDEKFEERWGSGLKEALIGKEIGKTYSENVLSEMSDGTAMYSDIKISSTVRPTMPCAEGSYQKDEKVTVEYTVTKPGEESETQTCAPFTLNQYAIGGMFGTGVVSDLMHALLYSTDKTIGTPVNVSYTDEDGVIYSNPRVVSVHKRADNPIVVQGQFPYDYKEESLRGKTAYFDVYPVDAIVYKTPELTESFITDTLKLTADDLSEYAGETFIEKYRESVRAELYKTYEETVDAQVEEGIWKLLMDKAVYREDKLPVGEVNIAKNSYVDGFLEYYNYYRSQYSTMADAACDYFGIADGANWESYADTLARRDTVQKLVLYCVAREQNLLPDEEELESLYNAKVAELLVKYLAEYKIVRESYASDEEYDRVVAEYREKMIAEYTEASIRDALVYEIAMPKMADLVVIKKP